MNRNDLEEIENVIGYEFHNKDLLQQAFVRKSYSEENGGENNEVLEFIGDKALDLAVVKILMDNYGWYAEDEDEYDSYEDENEFITDYTEGEFTNLKKKLVEKKMLAHRIDILGLNQYLIMGNGDINKNAQDEPSVKEDLFEAIIGAVALDCGWSLIIIETVVEIMLNSQHYLQNDFNEQDNYVDLIQQWVQKQYKTLPKYLYIENNLYIWERLINNLSIANKRNRMELGSGNITCELLIDNGEPFVGHANSKSEARMLAAKLAYEYLKSNNLLFTIKDEIDNPCEKLAVNQLQELAQKGYFDMPNYRFEESYDEQGYPAWKCYCSINYQKRICWWGRDYSKRGAKRLAAWCVLKQVLEIEGGD